MKNGRLFEILYILMEKQAVTAPELAARLEVSTRTIYRDIDALSAAGIPVFTQNGQGGGIRLMDQFVLEKTLLSPAQQDEILLALQAVLATGGVEGEGALARLTALFRRQGGDWLRVDFTDWGGVAAERENFSLVKEAILARRPLAFTYYSAAGEKTRRTTEPAQLVFKGGCWYLSAYCRVRQDWRFFRLMRMEGLKLLSGSCPPRQPPAQPQAPPPEAGQWVRLRLRFAPGAAWRVRDSFHPSQITAEPGGGLLVDCSFPEDQWLVSFLLSFGSQLQVVSPARWRSILAKEFEKGLSFYKTGHTLSGFGVYSDHSDGEEAPRSASQTKKPADQKEGTTMEKQSEGRSFCQCCGMPLDRPQDRGTEADGTLSGEYCRYCYQAGAFTAPDATVEEMIDFNLKFNRENGYPFGPQEKAEQMLKSWLPTLKRWRKG